MKKNNELRLIVGGLSAVVIVLAILLYALFRTPKIQNENPSINQPETPVATTSTNQTPTEVPPFADNHNIIDECITFKKADLVGGEGDYQKGSILVTFDKSVNFSQAKGIVEANNLKFTSNTQAQSSFSSGHWFSVAVPRGEEYRWMCVFEGSDLVVRALREPTFDLHQ